MISSSLQESAFPVIQNDGKMQMHPGWVGGVAGVVALVPEQCPGIDDFFSSAGREIGRDERIPIRISHVGVEKPDLAPRLERVGWDADDDSRLPMPADG